MRETDDKEGLAWIERQKEVVRHMLKSDLESAVRVLDDYLSKEISMSLRSDALAFRGSVKEDQGTLVAAKEDYLASHSLADPADYHRYVVEICLGSLSRQLGELEEAACWYVRALRTATQDPTTSGSLAIQPLLDLKGSLTVEETILAEEALGLAWELFHLPGSPDFGDLLSTLRVLKEAEGRPVPGSRNDNDGV